MPGHSRISVIGDTLPGLATWEHGSELPSSSVSLGLSAAIVAVRNGEPLLLTTKGGDGEPALPAGPFPPLAQGSLENGLRRWVGELTGMELGYTEQLSTFAESAHGVSVGYLGLTSCNGPATIKGFDWRSWYSYFPWEDWRKGRPDIIARRIMPRLSLWSRQPPGDHEASTRELSRPERVRIAFGTDGTAWDEERTLERYKLLCDAGLIGAGSYDQSNGARMPDAAPLAEMLRAEHCCSLAMAVDRLRGKIKHRPIVFEFMGAEFTLFELQKTVEAVLGSTLHKQNFRRLVENVGLVEATGEVRSHTGGRPAKLFRFRREALLEHPTPGLRVHAGR